jgi:hypothetical protein
LEHRRLSQKFEILTKQFQEFVSKFDDDNEPLSKKYKGKGKGRGKSSKNSLQKTINEEAEKRLRQFISQQNEAQSVQSEPIPGTSYATRFHTFPSTRNLNTNSRRESDSWTDDRDSTIGQQPRDPVTKTVFIRRIDCLLNASPIDQIEDKQSEDECIQAYFRLFTHNGQMNSLFTNSISYEEFR